MTFNLTWLARQMKINGLLSDNDYEDVTNEKSVFNNAEKAEKMLKSLEKKVELNSDNLSKFLGILKEKHTLYSEIIDIFEGKLLIENIMLYSLEI